jgi:hypothetical protein
VNYAKRVTAFGGARPSASPPSVEPESAAYKSINYRKEFSRLLKKRPDKALVFVVLA